jgi:hypothetical protein
MWKKLLRGLLWGGAILAILAAGFAAFVMYSADRVSFVASRDKNLIVTIPSPDDLKVRGPWNENPCRDLLLHNHELRSGNDLVLSYKRHNAGSVSVIDDEWYEILSVEIKDAADMESIALPSPRVRLFYSKGGSAWIHHCAGRYATSAIGTIELTKSWLGGMKVNINLALDAKSAQDDERTVEHLSVGARFR